MTTLLNPNLIGQITAIGKSLLTAANSSAARDVLELAYGTAPYPPGHLNGLELSNNTADAVNDIDVAAGVCSDSTGIANIVLGAMTKRMDANWSGGSGNGALDTGALVDGWYHVFAILKPTPATSDLLVSQSVNAPTLPTGYTMFRRIGSVLRDAGSLVKFRQWGDIFKWDVPRRSFTNTAAVALGPLALDVPPGVRVSPILSSNILLSAVGNAVQLMGDGEGTTAAMAICRANIASSNTFTNLTGPGAFLTNTVRQVQFQQLLTTGTLGSSTVDVMGWRDLRGRG
ncbi:MULTISPECIES: hypothetical protein [Phyllobacteriaceae]|jgi:hypothetical protein|uniref:Uncharacterized protein n=1 Tax=Mesorhizobium hungaricum TaxID=1566387 RepID=A0A1C2DD73_9HYPH|nr:MULTISPECIES: hypothetical protein [Mesorhizobium]MBN9235086.1 hypothetical protein [Mesorhizobium sp.]OCX12714.1 hypothetical protein QV13_24255 [Mesorhizobium hungaricum]